MSELPPTEEILEVLRHAVLPAAVTALVIAAVLGGLVYLCSRFASLDWRRPAPAVAVFALASAVWAGNLSREVFPTALPPVPDAKPWHWAWVAFQLAFAVELVARLPGVGVGAANLLRGAAAGVAASYVIPPGVQAEARWWLPAFAFAAAVQWGAVDAVARRLPGGWVAAGVALACGGAGAVLIHAESAGFMDVTVFLAAGLAVLALLAWVTASDAGSAAAVSTLPMLALLALGRHLRDSNVSPITFLIAGFAPLSMALFLLPGLRRLANWRLGGAMLALAVAGPSGYAIFRAMSEAPMTFAEETW